jgi:hypothetical protein
MVVCRFISKSGRKPISKNTCCTSNWRLHALTVKTFTHHSGYSYHVRYGRVVGSFATGRTPGRDGEYPRLTSRSNPRDESSLQFSSLVYIKLTSGITLTGSCVWEIICASCVWHDMTWRARLWTSAYLTCRRPDRLAYSFFLLMWRDGRQVGE